MTNEKPRVALCFSGQLRSLEKTYLEFIKPNLINYNSPYWDIHVFFHTWLSKEDLGGSYRIAGDKASGTAIPQDVLLKVYELYNPKKMLLEEQVEFDEKDYNDNKAKLIFPKYSLSKNYSMKQVAGLVRQYEKEKGFLYDMVFQLRSDFGIASKVDFDRLYQSLSMETRKVITSTHAGNSVDVTNGVMTSDTFQEYVRFYDHIDEGYRLGIRFSDENLMFFYLNKYDFRIERRHDLSNYILVR